MHFSRRHQIATCFEKKMSFRSIIKQKMTKTLETKKKTIFTEKGRAEVAKIIDKKC